MQINGQDLGTKTQISQIIPSVYMGKQIKGQETACGVRSILQLLGLSLGCSQSGKQAKQATC